MVSVPVIHRWWSACCTGRHDHQPPPRGRRLSKSAFAIGPLAAMAAVTDASVFVFRRSQPDQPVCRTR